VVPDTGESYDPSCALRCRTHYVDSVRGTSDSPICAVPSGCTSPAGGRCT
jgi:hypothetical protein